jgi:hypothetical protein
MNYQAFTNDTLLMMHHCARGALAVDDELKKLGFERRFRVRETCDWKKHAGALEAEMLRRGITFEAINWSDEQHSFAESKAVSHLADQSAPPSKPGPVEQGNTAESGARLKSRIAAALKMR